MPKKVIHPVVWSRGPKRLVLGSYGVDTAIGGMFSLANRVQLRRTAEDSFRICIPKHGKEKAYIELDGDSARELANAILRESEKPLRRRGR